MKWLYHIPHIFPDDGFVSWEDVYLMPQDKTDMEQSIWLTIDAIGKSDDDDYAWRKELLGANEYLLRGGDKDPNGDTTDMIIDVEKLTKELILKYAAIWLRDMVGDTDVEWIEVTNMDDMLPNQHTEEIAKAKQVLDDIKEGKVKTHPIRELIPDIAVKKVVEYGDWTEDDLKKLSGFGNETLKRIWDTPEEDEAWKDL